MKMNTFDFKPQKMVERLECGEHEGIIKEILFFEDKQYFVFEILVGDIIFNTAFAVNNVLFNNFALGFVDEHGFFRDDDLIDCPVKFFVENVNDKKSRITSIETL